MTAQVTEPSDFGKPPSGPATRWISEIELSEKYQRDWLDKCNKINRRYTEQRESTQTNKRKFAVLWANQETLRPAVYARPAIPNVSRRFDDPDPIGRVASEVLERALSANMDGYDFDEHCKLARNDYLLFARGQLWARYVPTFAKDAPEQVDSDDEGQVITAEAAQDVVDYEEALCDYVAWEDFGTNKARNWSEVYMVWRRVYLTREELTKRFGDELGKAIPLDWTPTDTDDNKKDNDAEQFKKARIYEIWDKSSRKVFWISKGFTDRPLDERDDPLGLKDFFPCPRPLLGTCGADSIVPVPDYEYYRDQAEEVDLLTQRIGVLTKALKVTGFYAGDEQVIFQQVFSDSNENRLVPVPTWAMFQDKGGAKGLIEYVPIDMVAAVLTGCFEARKQILDDIYQITGISDIMRGDTDPNETKGAQELKSTWGSSRVREKQNEMARFVRDALRIKAEIIAGKFSTQTLARMTNVKLLTNMEKQKITAAMQAFEQAQKVKAAYAAQQPQQPGMAPQAPAQPEQPPIPPDQLALMQQPSWEDVDALLKSNSQRLFQIDVETDSTIELDEQREKQQATEYVTAVGTVLSNSMPMIQMFPPAAKFIGSVLKFVGRKYHAGREMESELDQFVDQLSQMPPQQPEQGKPEANPQVEMMNAQTAKQEADNDTLRAQTEAGQAQADAQATQYDQLLEKLEIDAEDRRTQMQQMREWMMTVMGHQHDNAQNRMQHAHEAEQADLDRENQVKVAAAKPKPAMAE